MINNENQSTYIGHDDSANKIQIKVQDAYKIYKRGKLDVVALGGLNCNFYKGEIAVIMGPSGCGKTTLLNMIGGLDILNSGIIEVDGSLISQMTTKEIEKYRRDKVGFVFQFSSLIPELSAEENVQLPVLLTSGLNDKKKEYISELIDVVGLTDRKDHRPDELSGGEQQRIGVAAALANDPDIILCDEPTGELDSVTKLKIMDLLRKIIETYPHKTMIVVTHDPELRSIADRMYYIRDGNISHQFDKEELALLNKKDNLIQSISNGGAASNSADVANFLIELREIDHLVKAKIEKMEKMVHPV